MELGNRQASDKVNDLIKIVEEELKEELRALHRFLVDTEMKKGRHKGFNFQMCKSVTIVNNEKLEEVINKLDSAISNAAFGFVFCNVKTRKTVFLLTRNVTLFEKLHVLCTKAYLITFH